MSAKKREQDSAKNNFDCFFECSGKQKYAQITFVTIDIDNDDYSQFIEDHSQLPILGENGEIIV